MIERVDGELRCQQLRPRLPANTAAQLRLTNRSGGRAVFDATEFLVVSKNLKGVSDSDAFLGRVGLEDGTSVVLNLRTPKRPGEYPFACTESAKLDSPGPSGKTVESRKSDGVLVIGAAD
ncbi:hypothetical protein BV133_676 [Blastochloris viridis]|uniref:EfeO-type cupredoxin-like domain-containing protein n=1 Tax=Blastochloris viridis TaxID=1079 RepID=A0A182CYL3_BLAVI|nr:hypothetical protein BV133_676 [Blastochloris viridis]